MNKKSQALPGLGFAVVVALMIFFIGMLAMNFIRDEVTAARNVSNLNCSDYSISDGSKLTCLLIDIVVPYFIIIIIAAAGGIITARFVV